MAAGRGAGGGGGGGRGGGAGGGGERYYSDAVIRCFIIASSGKRNQKAGK